MKWPLAVAVLLLGAAAWRLTTSGAPGARQPSAETPAVADPLGHAPAGVTSAATAEPGPSPAASTPSQSSPAWQSMAASREHGDERAPPIERPTAESQAPAASAWELSDPVRYREYELRGRRRLHQEYLIAAEQELPKWKALLERARASGAPPAVIAEAQDKIRRLEARQIALRHGEPAQARKR
ncbi:hypothetical protein [Lysobacter sp. CA196]|uniref:hypothetical protein n=1 Tax=Lysobacter sp. CA196 TaxID=3455606 RepID=UPI003F8CF37A